MIRLPASRLAAAVLLAGAAAAMPAGAAPPADPAVQRQGVDTLLVTWRDAGPVDVLVADRPDAPAKAARLVSARDADGRAVVPQAGNSRSYVILRDVRSGDIARVAERLIPLEAGSNFRDIGGYPAAGGRHVKWGLIYRSGGTPLLTEGDRARIGGLGLASMVDLRSSEERVMAPSRIEGVPYTAVGYSMGAIRGAGGPASGYANFPTMLAPQVRQVFARLLRREVPLVYNCSAGQDRTGFTTALVLSALGTPYPTIVADYHLSTKFRRPEFELPRIDPAKFPGNETAAYFAAIQNDPRAVTPRPLLTADGKPYLDVAFAEMQRKWGGVNGYLAREIGLTPQDIARLRALYTM
jgi:protein-tyrosine phosphatase